MDKDFRLEITRGLERDKERTQFRARVVSVHNGNVLFESSEGYNNLEDLERITDRLFPLLKPNYEGEGWTSR